MPSSAEIAGIFEQMEQQFQPAKAGDTDAVIQFDLSGDNGGQYWVKISNGTVETGQGVAENPNMTFKSSADDYYAIANGNLNPMQAFMTGKVKVQGDMGLAMKMQSIFQM